MADDDGWTMIGKGQSAAAGTARKKTRSRKTSEPSSPPELLLGGSSSIPLSATRSRVRADSLPADAPQPMHSMAPPSAAAAAVAPVVETDATAAAAPTVATASAVDSEDVAEGEDDTPVDASRIEFRIDSADGCAYSLEEFRSCYGGTTANPPVEWTTSVLAGYGWPCHACGVLNAPADLGCRECHVARVEPPVPLEKKAGKLEAVLMIPQKSIGSLIGKAGAKIRIIRDTSRCYVHVSEERGERRVVTLTGTHKEIATCKELMRVAIDAVDDSMGETIKSEIARRKAALAATGGGRRGDPSLVVANTHPIAPPLLPPATSTGTPPVSSSPNNDVFPGLPATPSAATPPAVGLPPVPPRVLSSAPAPPSTTTAPTALSSQPSYAQTFPDDPAVGRTMLMSTSLDEFYRRAAATCGTEAERVLMATEVQIAVVRRGMKLLGHEMTTDQVRRLVQSSIEEIPVSFQQLCDVVKRVSWDAEPVPTLPSAAPSTSSLNGHTGPNSPPPALAQVGAHGNGSSNGTSCSCCTTTRCKKLPVWECSVCRGGPRLTFAAADACEKSHSGGVSADANPTCSACEERKPRSAFTKGQLGKTPGKRRCKQCVSDDRSSRPQATATRETPLRQQPSSVLATCQACGKPGADKTCTGCNAVKYCNVDCQSDDWKSGDHKTKCARLRRTPVEELPPQLAHPLHPAHALVLVLDGEPSDEPLADSVRCSVCTEPHFGVYFACHKDGFVVCSRVQCLSDAAAPATVQPMMHVPPPGSLGSVIPQHHNPDAAIRTKGGNSGGMVGHGANGSAHGSNDAFEITFLQASEFLLGDELGGGMPDTTATAAAESVLSSLDPPAPLWPDVTVTPPRLGANGSHVDTTTLRRPPAFSVTRIKDTSALPSLSDYDRTPQGLSLWVTQVSSVLEQSITLGTVQWPASLDRVDREIDDVEELHRLQLKDASPAAREAALAALPTLHLLRQRIHDARRQWQPTWNNELTRFETELHGMKIDVAKIEADARAETAAATSLRGALATANAQAAEFEHRLRDETEVVAKAASMHDYEQRLSTLVGMQSILADAVAASKAAVDHERNLQATTARATSKARQSALLTDEMELAAAKLNDLFGTDIVKVARPAANSASSPHHHHHHHHHRDRHHAGPKPDAAVGWGAPPKRRDGHGNNHRRSDSDDTSDEGAVSDEHDPHSYPLVPASHNRSRFFNAHAPQPVGTPTRNGSNGRLPSSSHAE
eukprot:m.162744 g.162744  ORF g.162744 m.162744 type:complete len:1229 (+) comp12234_c0_seq1:127-3813(+)